MIIKYDVPIYRKKHFENKKTLYGKVLQQQTLKNTEITLYKVQYINFYNYTDLLAQEETRKLNIIDKIRILFIK